MLQWGQEGCGYPPASRAAPFPAWEIFPVLKFVWVGVIIITITGSLIEIAWNR